MGRTWQLGGLVSWQERDPAASDDAGRLLLSLLSPAEQHRYRARGEIQVTGSVGGLWLIRYGYVGNVFHLPDMTSWCAHPPMDGAPVETAMIAQWLTLTHREPEFIAVANRHP